MNQNMEQIIRVEMLIRRVAASLSSESGNFDAVFFPSFTRHHEHFTNTTLIYIETAQNHFLMMDEPLTISHAIRADELSESQFIIIGDRPCRITSIAFSPTSHFYPTIHIVGTDITTPLKLHSFSNNLYQTYSLHSASKANIPIPEVDSIRADRLQVGDYVRHKNVEGHVKLLRVSDAGWKQQVHVVAIEPLSRQTMTAILWDDDIVQTPKLNITESRLRGFVEPQIVEISNPVSTHAPIECKELAKEIGLFFHRGKRDVWVRMALGVVIGAMEVRIMEAKWPEEKDREDEFLALLADAEVPEMVIKKPGGIKADMIAGFIRDGKRFMVRLRAEMWNEEKPGQWTVDEVIALEDIHSQPLWSTR